MNLDVHLFKGFLHELDLLGPLFYQSLSLTPVRANGEDIAIRNNAWLK
jgi:hypothetical protein